MADQALISPEAMLSIISSGSQRAKRPYVRKSNNVVSGLPFPTSPPQISELAFNVHGWALEDGMKNRETFEAINAYNATMVKGGFEAKIKDLKSELEVARHAEIYRDNLTYTDREKDEGLSERDSAVARYLIVGYTLQEDDPIFVNNKSFVRYSDNELVGETRPIDHRHIINWDACLTPILVVTPIKENTGTSVRLFGLITPKSGLCQPVLIQHERIFYRWEFRASAGARWQQRNKNWNSLVVEKAKMLTPFDPLSIITKEEPCRPTKKVRTNKTIKEEDKEDVAFEVPEVQNVEGKCFELRLNLDVLLESASRRNSDVVVSLDRPDFTSIFKIALTPSTEGILKHIRASQVDRVAQELRSLLKVDKPRVFPVERSAGLQHFGLLGVSLHYDENDAFLVAEEVKDLFPELYYLIDVNKLLRIKYAMDLAGLSLGMEVMEKFLSMALAYLQVSPQADGEFLAKKLLEMSQIASALYQSHSSIASAMGPIQMDTVYLVSLLRQLIRYYEWESQGTKALFGNSLVIPTAFAKRTFEYCLDIGLPKDITELQSTIKELLAIAKTMNASVEDVLIWLERLRRRIKQA